MFNHLRMALLILSIPLALSACAVGMAMSGTEEPDLGAVRVGTTRGEVELHMGYPSRTTTLEGGGRLDVYEYEIGDEPSTGRAIGHGIMDILTLGIWEIVGTPIEGFRGDKHYLTVTYDSDDRVTALKSGRGTKAF